MKGEREDKGEKGQMNTVSIIFDINATFPLFLESLALISAH